MAPLVCLCSQEVRAIRRSACVRASFKCPVWGGGRCSHLHLTVSAGVNVHTHTHTDRRRMQHKHPGETAEEMNRGTLKKKKKGVYSRVRLIFSPVCLSISWQLPCWIMTVDSDSARPVRLQTPGSDQCLICSSSAERGGVNERCK